MWWLVFPGVLLLLVAVILIRTLSFKPKKQSKQISGSVIVNSEKSVSDLAEMIRCKTVSDRDPSCEDQSQFDRFEDILPKLFPGVFKKCSFEKVGKRGLLFCLKGKNSNSPSVFMAHYDVVGVNEHGWEKPPFDGIVENGVLWGRGTLDTKATVNGILGAAEALIAEGFVPENDIYFAFGGDEEINGNGAPGIVELFRSRGITPSFVLDEGGAICYDVFPGVKKALALIGIAEKGMLNLEYSVNGDGGHSSSPKPLTPISRLARAVTSVEKSPFRFTLTKPALEFFNIAGRHSTFLYRMIFANLWFFGPVFSLIAVKSGGETNAIVRTTTAFTQMEGSKGANVIPAHAAMVSNHRIIPGETVESTVKRIRGLVKDNNVEISVINGFDPSGVSRTDCEEYFKLHSVISEIWQEATVTPYLMVACSDARHWSTVCDKVYRFSPIVMTKEDRDTIHGNNERIPLAAIGKIVEFYIRLMKRC